jgi:demethylmenaquinone methyltransferase / 2-methoxy-6-polyprenyl-1,4-benzoquinol methylase
LDLGSGTGDLVRTALKQESSIHAFAADFTLTMMRIGKQRQSDGVQHGLSIRWVGADAAYVPFDENTFDAVVSGFLLRNVIDLQKCLAEQFRVLKPGGLCVALDTSPPPKNILRPILEFHLHKVIPTLGRLIANQADAYHYLPETTEGFLRPEQLAERFETTGFESISFERRMFGTIAILWGCKPGGKGRKS